MTARLIPFDKSAALASSNEGEIAAHRISLTDPGLQFLDGVLYRAAALEVYTASQIQCEDGVAVLVPTGEVIGTAVPLDVAPSSSPEVPDSLAEWVMSILLRHATRQAAYSRQAMKATERLSEIELAALDALRQDPEYLEAVAVRDNAAHLSARAARSANLLRDRFHETMKAWALRRTAGAKSRTVSTIWGTVSLRKVAAKVEVSDIVAAVEWARRHCPAAIRESVGISLIPKEVKTHLVSSRLDGTGFSVVPEHDALTISTPVPTETK